MRFDHYRDIEVSKLTGHELQGELQERWKGAEYTFIGPDETQHPAMLGRLCDILRMFDLSLVIDEHNIPGQCRLLAVTLDHPQPGEYSVRYADTNSSLYLTSAMLALNVLRSKRFSKLQPSRETR